MRRIAIIGIGLCVVAVGIGWWLSRPKVYEAKVIYARAKSPITLDEKGELVQPPEPIKLNWVVDRYYNVPGSIENYLRSGLNGPFTERFLNGPGVGMDPRLVGKAFKSFLHQIRRGNIPTVELSARSESKAVALAVVKWVADERAAFLETENRERLERETLQLENEREHRRRQGNDISDIQKKLDELISEIKRNEDHIYTVKPPYICNE